jgi:hypothetical protein
MSLAAQFDVSAFERARVITAANQFLKQKPVTITASHSPRSAGGLHDFFSEGDYWWPDPANPSGPYIQRDGMKDQRYARHAALHLRAWFIDPGTRMNPNLQFAQAIHGRFTGRGTGIIDTIHLVEIARAVEVLDSSGALSRADLDGVRKWFAEYTAWITTHEYGIAERDAANNHATCWVMQVAAFARLTANAAQLSDCRNRFKTILLPNQLAPDGSFPQELRRTKPYGYSLFNLEAMAAICQILSTRSDNPWTFQLPDGRGMRTAMAFMTPYVRDKSTWKPAPDVMYFDQWPMRQSSLLFAGLAFGNRDYIDLWKSLPADSAVEEVIRNFFIRQPALWVE